MEAKKSPSGGAGGGKFWKIYNPRGTLVSETTTTTTATRPTDERIVVTEGFMEERRRKRLGYGLSRRQMAQPRCPHLPFRRGFLSAFRRSDLMARRITRSEERRVGEECR